MSTSPRRRSRRSSTPAAPRSADGWSGCSPRTPPPARSRRRRRGTRSRRSRSRSWAPTGGGTRDPLPTAARPPPPRATADAGLPTTEESGSAPRTRTHKLPTPTPLAPPKAACRRPARRARRLPRCRRERSAAGAAAAPRSSCRGHAGAKPRRRRRRLPKRTPAATPYDFDADGRQELVMALLRGAPRGRRAHSGVVLVQDRGEEAGLEPDHRGARRPAWTAAHQRRFRLGARERGLRSRRPCGPRDRHARPRARLRALRRAGGPDRRRTRQLTGGGADLPPGAGRYGFTLVASDLDDDGFDDLVVGAPGELGGSRPAERCTSSSAAGAACARIAHGSSGGRPPACPGSATAWVGGRRRRRPARSRGGSGRARGVPRARELLP